MRQHGWFRPHVRGLTAISSTTLREGVGYEPEASALFARFTTPATTARKTLINNLVRSLKMAGVWSKLDAIYIMAAETEQAAERNWVADLYNLTAVNSPTFAADRGYTGNGTTAYLNTSFNATTASSPKFTQNSAHVSVWDRTSRAGADTSLLGARESTTKYIDIAPRTVLGPNFIGRINSAAAALSTSSASSVGHFMVNRSASTALQGYKNGAEVSTSTAVSVVSPNVAISLLARALTGGSPDAASSDQIAAASIGGSLTAVEAAALYSNLNTYLTAVGAA